MNDSSKCLTFQKNVEIPYKFNLILAQNKEISFTSWQYVLELSFIFSHCWYVFLTVEGEEKKYENTNSKDLVCRQDLMSYNKLKTYIEIYLQCHRRYEDFPPTDNNGDI